MQSQATKATSSNFWLRPRAARHPANDTSGRDLFRPVDDVSDNRIGRHLAVPASSTRGFTPGLTGAHNLSTPTCVQKAVAVEPVQPVLGSAQPVKSVQPWRTPVKRDTPSCADALARGVSPTSTAFHLDMGVCLPAGRQSSSFDGRPGANGGARNSPYGSPYHPSAPKPQDLRGNESKYKSELCSWFARFGRCKFGARCNFAHGEGELRSRTLMAMDRAGGLDKEIYRCHACLTFVSTGACPFGDRCGMLHDPRIAGPDPYWLTHEELGSRSGPNTRVDRFCHQQLGSVYGCSPIYGFAPRMKWTGNEEDTLEAFSDIYRFCSNMGEDQDPEYMMSWVLPDGRGTLTEANRLAIALSMRQSCAARSYAFVPTHVLGDQPVMVLRTGHFLVRDWECVEVSPCAATTASTLRSGSGDFIISAREIAFGPVGDARTRPVSVWFDVDADDLPPCTLCQARSYSRQSNIRAKNHKDQARDPLDRYCAVPPFECHQPVDDDAFELISGFMRHRLDSLRHISSSDHDTRDTLYSSLCSSERRLFASFVSQRRWWSTWTWPKQLGSSDIDETTPLPDVNGVYHFVPRGHPEFSEDDIFFGADRLDRVAPGQSVASRRSSLTTSFLWQSFVRNLGSDRPSSIPSYGADSAPALRRLGTLKDLALERKVAATNLTIPKIGKSRISATSFGGTAPVPLFEPLEEWMKMNEEFSNDASRRQKRDKATVHFAATPTTIYWLSSLGPSSPVGEPGGRRDKYDSTIEEADKVVGLSSPEVGTKLAPIV